MMNQERLLELAKIGLKAEIEKAEGRIRKGEKILFDRRHGFENKARKSNEEIKEIISRYEYKVTELKKEYDKINDMIFDLDFQ